jgi:hypothetical protein
MAVDRQIVAFCSGISARGVSAQAGQNSSASGNQDGPCDHTVKRKKSSGDCPREMRSAGLSVVGTCLHSEAIVFCWISATRFATKVFSVWGDALIQCNTIVESVQYTVRAMLIVNDCRTVVASEARSAPLNSSLGMV